ncbi:MAG: carbohydrate-binding module family 20 domain-containing protein [Mycobacteriales bacterium]
MNRIRTLAVVAVAAAASSAGLVASSPAAPVARAATPAATGANDVIANLFEWPWTSVAGECTNVLGPKGYGAVQVAPPEESVSLPNNNPAHPWWEVYQPASYQLSSRMGNRSQFASMVQTCHAAGVKVYVDAVVNHMTGSGSAGASGYAGSTFSKYDYPGTYSAADFHYYPGNCPESDDQIHDWNSSTEVWNCELLALSDLNTGTDYVRGRIAAYLNDLLGLGVDGFRVDAAKHISQTDMAAIRSRLTNPGVYFAQEVMPGGGGSLDPGAYTVNGGVLEFRYGQALKSAFGGGSIAGLSTLGQSGMVPSSQATVFVDNHDTQRDGSMLTYKDGAVHTLAQVFELAWNYGTPNIMSSFDFSDNDQGPPSAANGMVNPVSCGSGWECEHRARAVANMVGFHNATRGTPVGNWWSDGSNQIAFSRGASGWVAINKESGTLSRTFATGLPAGSYCDVIHGDFGGGSCSGTTVCVDSAGNAAVTVNAMDAVAIDAAARVGSCTAQTAVQVTFNEYATTYWGQNVYVVGSIPALGNWDPAAAVPLSSANYPTWTGTATLPAGITFQYKYLKKNPDNTVTWESDPNRTYTTGTGAVTLNDTWR